MLKFSQLGLQVVDLRISCVKLRLNVILLVLDLWPTSNLREPEFGVLSFQSQLFHLQSSQGLVQTARRVVSGVSLSLRRRVTILNSDGSFDWRALAHTLLSESHETRLFVIFGDIPDVDG